MITLCLFISYYFDNLPSFWWSLACCWLIFTDVFLHFWVLGLFILLWLLCLFLSCLVVFLIKFWWVRYRFLAFLFLFLLVFLSLLSLLLPLQILGLSCQLLLGLLQSLLFSIGLIRFFKNFFFLFKRYNLRFLCFSSWNSFSLLDYNLPYKFKGFLSLIDLISLQLIVFIFNNHEKTLNSLLIGMCP